MRLKQFAFVALLAVPAICGFGTSAMAEDGKWSSPNVPGQPGYKEPPKVDEVHAPRPAKDPKYGGGYQSKHTEEAK